VCLLPQILHAAYKVEITVRAGASVMRLLLEKMKQLIHMMPWKCPPVVNTEFKIRVAEDMLKSLNSTR
jgi:receptor-interacting serine/threonine-protein kinase 5